MRNSILKSDISDHFPGFSMHDFSDLLPRRSQGGGFSSLNFMIRACIFLGHDWRVVRGVFLKMNLT